MKWSIYPLFLLLAACSSLPPAIEDAPLVDVTYPQANKAIANFPSAPVRWGGVVINVENEQSASVVQVLSYPLNHYGKPRLDKPSEGRFVVRTPEFLDPAEYAANSEITVAGVLKGDEARLIGKKELRLPVVSANVIHLWPVDDRKECYGNGGFAFGFGYNPYFSPFYGYGPRYSGPYPRWR
ncbi:MAG: Slp family lipoprotein [Methylococcales bacterium]|nr:hypothetical protein [Methylococcaceae bacterium]